jgi:hypothetical protein
MTNERVNKIHGHFSAPSVTSSMPALFSAARESSVACDVTSVACESSVASDVASIESAGAVLSLPCEPSSVPSVVSPSSVDCAPSVTSQGVLVGYLNLKRVVSDGKIHSLSQ